MISIERFYINGGQKQVWNLEQVHQFESLVLNEIVRVVVKECKTG